MLQNRTLALSAFALVVALFIAQAHSGKSYSRRLQSYNSFFGSDFGSNPGDTYYYNSFFGSSFGSQSERDKRDGVYRGGSTYTSTSSKNSTSELPYSSDYKGVTDSEIEEVA